MKHPNKIHEFDPLLYPTRLWVGVNIPFKDVCDKFYAINSDDTVTDFSDAVEQFGTSAVAACYPVGDKKTGWRGIFCHIFRPKFLSVGVIAHEAEHTVCWICEQFGIESTTFEDSEPRAYLIQYIANCINQVKTNKIEKK